MAERITGHHFRLMRASHRRGVPKLLWPPLLLLCHIVLILRTADSASPPLKSSGDDGLEAFARDWFVWRSRVAPLSTDDLPRAEVTRPSQWAYNASGAAFNDQERRYETFRARLESLRATSSKVWQREDVADFFALSSALNRAYFELHILRSHRRDPSFAVIQGPGAVWDSLVRESNQAWSAARLEDELLPRVEAVPRVLGDGRALLEASSEGRQASADVALGMLGGANGTMGASLNRAVVAALASAGTDAGAVLGARLRDAGEAASEAVEAYSSWLYSVKPSLSSNSSLGEGALQWYLKHVALVEMSTNEVIALGRDELARATSLLEMETMKNDHAGLPTQTPIFSSFEEQANATLAAEREIQAFLRERKLMDLAHLPEPAYRVQQIPPWLAPFEYSALGEEDDWDLVDKGGFVRYLPRPQQGLPFFLDILARDPRPVIVHEGVPGHWCQFTKSRMNAREARRHWLDSCANEGLAYYFEQLTLLSGLYDDRPRTREVLYQMQRLRAVRAQVDAGLASGCIGVTEADALLRTVVSSSDTRAEVATRLVLPGQGLSYVVGKQQVFEILRKLRRNGTALDLRALHNSLLLNGNVPLSVQSFLLGATAVPDPAEVTLHSAYPGVGPEELAAATQSLSRVRGLPGMYAGISPVTYAGYVATPAGTSQRDLYYVLARGTDTDAPLVIWLQGGNGCSSLTGFLSENGYAFSPDGQTLEPSPTSWTSFASVLYLDRPAGAGFSFSRSDTDPSTYANDATTASDTLSLLEGVLREHQWLCGREIFIAGEQVLHAAVLPPYESASAYSRLRDSCRSYAGHFTVQLAALIARRGTATKLCGSRLAGVIVGNGVVDINQTNFAWFEMGATHSTVPKTTWDTIRSSCDFSQDLGIDGNGCPSNQSSVCRNAIELWFNQSASGEDHGLLSLYDYSSDVCLPSQSPDGTVVSPNLDSPCIDATTLKYLSGSAVRAALHVDHRASPWSACSEALNNAYSCSDTLASVVPLYQALLDSNYSVLVYSGDQDGVVPTPATKRWVEGLHAEVVKPWKAWRDDDGQLGGYSMVLDGDGGSLTFSTVRGAGHMVPRTKGKRALALVRDWVQSLH